MRWKLIEQGRCGVGLAYLFGTVTAVSKDTASWYTKNVEEFYANDPTALAAVQRENAYRLFPRLCDRLQQRP